MGPTEKKRTLYKQVELSKPGDSLEGTNSLKSRKRRLEVTSQQTSIVDSDVFAQPKAKRIRFSESPAEVLTPKTGVAASTIKPNWKKIKEEHVNLRKQRKEKGPNYNVVFEAKRIWEQVRRIDCPVAKKAELTVTLHDVVKDNIGQIVFAHDTSRIVQWLLKLTTPEIRSSVCESLYSVVVEMMMRRFSSHVIRCMLKYGDKNCINKVINILQGNIMKLITNNVSAPILECMYSEHASAEQKKLMEQELFGNSWKIAAGPEIKSLKDAIMSSSEMKNGILTDTKENVIRVINKNITSSGLLHSVILQFFNVCSSEDKDEILSLLSSHILDLVGTKAGTQIGMQCCWFSSKKTKKSIIKQLKGKVGEVSTMEEGYWLILAILDSVDDTVLLKKTIVSEILDKVTTIIKKEQGRRVVLYMVSHRDKTYFHPNDIALLEQGDNSGTVLKSMETRRSEIFPSIIESLLKSITAEISTWMHDASLAMVTLAVLKAGSGEPLQTALDVLAKFVCSDTKIREMTLSEHAGINRVLISLLKHGRNRESKEEMFAYHLACNLDENSIKQLIAGNRGCFILVNILETVKEEPKSILLGKINEEISELVDKASNVGATILKRYIVPPQSSTP